MASFVLRAGERARIRLGVRQKCPGLPNLRDHGLTVDRVLLGIVSSLQRAHGYAWPSEATLRSFFHQDTGHMPGVGTIAAALRRLELLGYVEVRWIHRGSTTPDGGVAQVGCLRLRVGQCRNERRRIAARAPHVNRREGVSGRVTFAVPAFQPSAPQPPDNDERQRVADRRIAEHNARAQELIALFDTPS